MTKSTKRSCSKAQSTSSIGKNHNLSFFKCFRCGGEFNKFRREVSQRRHVYSTCPLLLKNSSSNQKLSDGNADAQVQHTTENDSCDMDFDIEMDFGDAFSMTSEEKKDDEEEEEEDSEAENDSGNENVKEHDSESEDSIELAPQQVLNVNKSLPSLPALISIDESSTNHEFKKQLEYFTFAKSHGVSRNTIDGLVGLTNQMLQDRGDKKLLYSHHIVRKNLFKSLPFSFDTYKACADGCQSFYDGVIKPCLNKKDKKSNINGTVSAPVSECQEYTYISLIHQLAAMLSEPETLDLLKYPYFRNKDSNVIGDIFDGEICRRLKADVFQENRLTIYMGLYSDGFQVLENQKHGLTLVNVVILNFPPSIRTEKKYMIQLLVTPGPKSPRDLFSYLDPIFKEMKILEHGGIKLTNSDIIVKAHFLFAGGDIPATTKMAGLKGHTARFGCKHCTVSQNNWSYQYVDGAKLRTLDSYKTADESIGQREPTPFSDLKYFHGTFFFPIDLMHLLGANIGPQIRLLMTSREYNHSTSSKSNPFNIDSKAIQEVDSILSKSTCFIPTTFSGKIVDLSTTSQKRSVDWIHFLRFVLPTVMLDFFDEETRSMLVVFSKICNMICQRNIKKEDVSVLEKHIRTWTDWLSRMIEEERLANNTFTTNHHYLLHVPLLIKYLGPMNVYAAFSMEFMNGVLKHRVRAKTKIGQNASYVLREVAAENRLERLFPVKDEKERKALVEDNPIEGMEVWGPFGEIEMNEADRHLGINGVTSLIKKFHSRYYGKDRTVCVGEADILELGFNLRMPEGIVFGCSLGHIPGNRVHFFVKLNMRLDIIKRSKKVLMKTLTFFGEIITYFRYRPLGGESHLLAFVRVYEVKQGPVFPYKLPSAASKVIIISVHEIASLCGRYVSSDNREHIVWKSDAYDDYSLGKISLI